MSRQGDSDNAFIQLRHFASTLDSGVTERTVCPWCIGGTTKEKSFAVSRTSDAEAKYICHRASCGRHGRIAVWGFRIEASDPTPKAGKSFTPRLHSRDTRELGEEWASELLDLYGIDRSEADRLEWRVELGSGNLVVPVRSPSGVVRGVEVRRSKVQVPFISTPKTEPHRVLDEPWMGWYREISTGPVIFVEDAISALKVSRHFQVACLHGSHITQDMMLEAVSVVGNDPTIIALDRDATGKAIKFASEWRFIAPNFRAVPLSKDLKYNSDDEIKRILSHA